MTEPRYDDLKALFINCTLKRSPEVSNTQGLVDLSRHVMEKHGVQVEVLRAIDHDIATGVWPDMTEHGWASDEWPAIFDRVLAASYTGGPGAAAQDPGPSAEDFWGGEPVGVVDPGPGPEDGGGDV